MWPHGSRKALAIASLAPKHSHLCQQTRQDITDTQGMYGMQRRLQLLQLQITQGHRGELPQRTRTAAGDSHAPQLAGGFIMVRAPDHGHGLRDRLPRLVAQVMKLIRLTATSAAEGPAMPTITCPSHAPLAPICLTRSHPAVPCSRQEVLQVPACSRAAGVMTSADSPACLLARCWIAVLLHQCSQGSTSGEAVCLQLSASPAHRKPGRRSSNAPRNTSCAVDAGINQSSVYQRLVYTLLWCVAQQPSCTSLPHTCQPIAPHL
jgi:hypothetical protein